MKTLEQIKTQHKSKTLDGREMIRLAQFIPEDQLGAFGLTLNPAGVFTPKHVCIEFTREAVVAQLKKDVAFGFEKALDKRGISAGIMFQVVRFWNWILEEGLEDYNEDSGYAQYGLPLFKATAVKYDFPNPIGDDRGDEYKYSDECDDIGEWAKGD